MLKYILNFIFGKKTPAGIEKTDGYFGAIEKYDTRDLVGSQTLVESLPDAPRTFWNNPIEYHQPDVHKVSCTIHAACGALSALTGRNFSIAERKEMVDIAKTRGYDVNVGWYLNKAVQLVYEFHNATRGSAYPAVKYYRFETHSRDAWEMRKKGYGGVTGYRGNQKYNKDQLDGVLHKYKFGRSTYGHAIWHCADPEKKWERRRWDKDMFTSPIQDYVWQINSYVKTLTHNRLKIPYYFIPWMIDNGTYFKYSYFYVIDDTK